MTAEERFLQCLAFGGDTPLRRATCADLVDSERVAGVWCDGQIVYDETGKHCIPRAIVDARAKLAVSPSPSPSPAASSPGSSSLLPLAIVGLVVIGFVLSKR